jgi:remodeling and spacing factor 1
LGSKDEMEAVKGAGNQGRGKDISTIVNAEKEDELLPSESAQPPEHAVSNHQEQVYESKDNPVSNLQKSLFTLKLKFIYILPAHSIFIN